MSISANHITNLSVGLTDRDPKVLQILVEMVTKLKCSPYLDQRELEFSGVMAQIGGGADEPFMSEIGTLLPMALCGRNKLTFSPFSNAGVSCAKNSRSIYFRLFSIRSVVIVWWPGSDMRLLLVEDDRMIAEALMMGFGRQAVSADWVKDGPSALEAIDLAEYAVVLLDLGLPKMDGTKVLDTIRKRGLDIPVLILTARDDLASRIHGLDLGADDYVLKPFEFEELMARIRAVVRRKAGHSQSIIQAGEVSLDLATQNVTFRNISETLSAREFAVLRELAECPGRILSRGQLEERIYGWGEEIESNAIEVLIYYIRKRFHKDIIRNVRGAGWMIPKV